MSGEVNLPLAEETGTEHLEVVVPHLVVRHLRRSDASAAEQSIARN